MNDILYHITKKRHLDRIFIEGLKAGRYSRRVGLTCRHYMWDKIFLTDNLNHIISTQATERWMKDAIILEVDVKGLIIEKHFNDRIIVTNLDGKKGPLIHPNEYTFKGIIEPNRLKISKDYTFF